MSIRLFSVAGFDTLSNQMNADTISHYLQLGYEIIPLNEIFVDSELSSSERQNR